jgi:ABC-type glycerol-3-phosphate transport system substrate-binding protein
MVLGAALPVAACGRRAPPSGVQLTVSGSTLGSEGQLLAREIARLRTAHPNIHVRVQPTPDDATQRHQLYVQRLNARAGDRDVLPLDVVWTAAGALNG